MTDDLRMLDELEALEKAATPPPWKEDANRLSILCDGINGGEPYEGYIGAMGYHDNRELTIAARNALPTLLRLARRGLEAGEVEATIKRVAEWMERHAEHDEQQAKSTRFETMRDAYTADAKNYRKVAKDLNAALARLAAKEER